MVKHSNPIVANADADDALRGESILDATFGALADSTRRGILARLAQGESSVSDLAAPYAMSLPAVSKHLRVLERARLVRRDRQGRVSRCRLLADPMKHAAHWIASYRRFWEDQFDFLERYLDQTQTKESALCPPQVPQQPGNRSFKSGAPSPRRGSASTRHGRTAKS